MADNRPWSDYVVDRTPRLLANGEVLTPPPLERSPGLRRVRMKDSKQSFPNTEAGVVLHQAVIKAAEAEGTTVRCPIRPWTLAPTPTIHSITRPSARGRHIETLWWLFRDPDSPISCLLSLTVTVASSGTVSDYYVYASLEAPRLGDHGSYTSSPNITASADPQWWSARGLSGYEKEIVMEMTRDDPQEWVDHQIFAQSNTNSLRLHVKDLLNRIEAFEDLAQIVIPDISNRQWITLPLHSSNMTEELRSDLMEILDASATIHDIKEAYDEFLSAMSRGGYTLPPRSENELLAALSIPSESAYVSVGTPIYNAHNPAEDQPDNGNHLLYLHLPTGTFAVGCQKNEVTLHEGAAHAWEEAQAVASITGRSDELLQFASEYIKNGADRKVRQFVNDRRLALK